MKKNIFIITLLVGCCSLSAWAQKQEKTITVEVNNNWNRAKTDEPVVINLRDLHTGFKVKSAVVMEGSTEIPSQLDDLNRDRKMDELAFVTSLPAHGRKTFQVTLSSEKSTKTYPARVYAEMFIADPRKGKHQSVQAITVPGTSNIYSMVRPHGPVLESELVGYRLYFNEKQTPDIYGKFNKGLEIKESQFYPTDEQLARGFGDDVLRVFDSCGPGAFKGWDGKKATHITPVATRTERIISYGPVRVIAEIEVTGWKYQNAELDMMTRYTLYAGHRDVEVDIRIDGGRGVGRVTKPGLDQPVGAAAINHVPRQMITEALRREAEAACYPGGFAVTISIPGGEEVARRTFNPHIGVEGGLSVLGTSGIVEPMSQQAILDTIQLEMNQAALRAKDHRRLILAPGNYGLDYLHETYPQFAAIPVVKTSNFIGDTLDMAATTHFEQVLLVGHIGKLCKLAGGIMNTHSHTADCRTELFCTHAALCGADREVCTALYNAATTDACLEILDTAGLREPVLQSLLAAIQLHLDRRAGGAFRVGAVLFSNQFGPLGQTETAARLLNEWKE